MKPAPALVQSSARSRPAVGFIGLGWIGRHRMQAVVESGAAQTVAIADPSDEALDAAGRIARQAQRVGSLEEMLELDLDGIVIATPSALHATQSVAALERGVAVFCQKPLGRTCEEVRRVVDAARANDVLLGIDLSYRHTEGMRRVRDIVRAGEVGEVFAGDLVFHNAYGPDKAWFYDLSRSGGGCVMDLGVHLVDLGLWTLGFPKVRTVTSSLLARGLLLPRSPGQVEDFATATLELETGAVLRIVCSWHLHAGCDAFISADFYGTEGGVSFRNVNGSFYDFLVERFNGTARERLLEPPDQWGGRAAVEWSRSLAAGARFDASIGEAEHVARTLDRIYRRAS